MYWIYKCNDRDRNGDWADVFHSTRACCWGLTANVPELEKASEGDLILAYQTDRNELVGIAKVTCWKPKGKRERLFLKPVQTIGARVRPLKKKYPRIAQIPALQQGRIHTLYDISYEDAVALIDAAEDFLAFDSSKSLIEGEMLRSGAGFGSPETNKVVEEAAVRKVVEHYEANGYDVRDVSAEQRGYDLLCTKGTKRLRVEVKGAQGGGQQFIITGKELRCWSGDKKFVLAFVRMALSKKPSILFFAGLGMQKQFSIRPLSYIVKRKPKR